MCSVYSKTTTYTVLENHRKNLMIRHFLTLCLYRVNKYKWDVFSFQFQRTFNLYSRNYNLVFTIGWLTSNVRWESSCFLNAFSPPSLTLLPFSFVELKAHENWSRFAFLIIRKRIKSSYSLHHPSKWKMRVGRGRIGKWWKESCFWNGAESSLLSSNIQQVLICIQNSDWVQAMNAKKGTFGTPKRSKGGGDVIAFSFQSRALQDTTTISHTPSGSGGGKRTEERRITLQQKVHWLNNWAMQLAGQQQRARVTTVANCFYNPIYVCNSCPIFFFTPLFDQSKFIPCAISECMIRLHIFARKMTRGESQKWDSVIYDPT